LQDRPKFTQTGIFGLKNIPSGNPGTDQSVAGAVVGAAVSVTGWFFVKKTYFKNCPKSSLTRFLVKFNKYHFYETGILKHWGSLG
jgi:hypothetical protein